MHIASMTGFARVEGKADLANLKYDWAFEIKSVNGKNLDIKFKLPSFLDSLSLELKEIAAGYFSRGSISVFLELNSQLLDKQPQVNVDLLHQLAEAAVDVSSRYGDKFRAPSLGELLALPQVVEFVDKRLDETQLEALKKALKDSFMNACEKLQEARLAEGDKIKGALLDIGAKINKVVAQIEVLFDKLPQKIKEGLQSRVAELSGDLPPISEERLAQEIVLYVTRADIREEIDRLKAHMKTFSELLKASQPAGRRLDFLCQELNREANTTCSKSMDITLTNLGMELKALIEQLREQVQNME